jgi:hypothetical protein
MHGIVCDGCGTGLLLEGEVRYVLRIEGFAAWDPLEITREELEGRDFEREMAALMAELSGVDPQEGEDQVHRAFRFDLCPRCWRRYLKSPLGALRGSENNEKSQGD